MYMCIINHIHVYVHIYSNTRAIAAWITAGVFVSKIMQVMNSNTLEPRAQFSYCRPYHVLLLYIIIIIIIIIIYMGSTALCGHTFCGQKAYLLKY